MEYTSNNKISEELVQSFNEEMTSELAKRLEEENYKTPFEGLQDWHLLRALAINRMIGVSQGFQKKLEINGVGYRVKVSGDSLEMSLGFSHPIIYKLPEGVSAEAPSNTELVLSSVDKQLLGDAASKMAPRKPIKIS